MNQQASQHSPKFIKQFTLVAWIAGANGLLWTTMFFFRKAPGFLDYFNAIVWWTIPLMLLLVNKRLLGAPAIWLSDDILTYKQGILVRKVPLATVKKIHSDGVHTTLFDDAGARIKAFKHSEYDTLDWLSTLIKNSTVSPVTLQTSDESGSMKKQFAIAFGISFGAMAALLIIGIIVLSMGIFKRDIFGNIVLSAPARDPGAMDDYDKRAAATKALVISEVKWVKQKDTLDVMFTVENTKDYALDDAVFFQLVFLRGDDLKGVASELENVVVPALGKVPLIMQVRKDVPTEFDVLRITPKH